jgi:hypothetical protein
MVTAGWSLSHIKLFARRDSQNHAIGYTNCDIERSSTMNPPPLCEISHVNTSALDADSLRLVAHAVEVQAKRLRSEASRALLRRLGRLICHSMSIPTSPR